MDSLNYTQSKVKHQIAEHETMEKLQSIQTEF